MIQQVYSAGMLKKLIVLVSLLIFAGLFSPALSRAQDSTETCTTVTQYGGAVSYICGASTHVPVNTGIADNLALLGALSLGASGILLYFSKKFNKSGI